MNRIVFVPISFRPAATCWIKYWYDVPGFAMPQLVFEFWCREIEPVVRAIKLVLDAHPTENQVAPHSIHYEPTQQGLDWAAQQICAGHVGSFVLRPKIGGIRYAMLNGPGIVGGQTPGYLGTVEYTQSDYSHIWAQLLSVDGLQIICLGHEEGVEINGNQLVAETFPWDDYFLVVGAVRNRAGDWTLKHGPSYFPSGGNAKTR